MSERDILTYSNQVFDFWLPDPKVICLLDIAHALACKNRYNGHTRIPYSVAEHSVRMSYLTVATPLIALLHDSAEAYIGDVVSPHKKGLQWDRSRVFLLSPLVQSGRRSFKEAERLILQAIGVALEVEELEVRADFTGIKKADRTMLATEVRDLMPEGALEHPVFARWVKGLIPDPGKIEPWHWSAAETKFINRFKELTHG